MKAYGVGIRYRSAGTLVYDKKEGMMHGTSEAFFYIFKDENKAQLMAADLSKKYPSGEEKFNWAKETVKEKGTVIGSVGVFPVIGDFIVKEIDIIE